MPVTFVSTNFTKILKELRVGSSHTLQEFFLPFHYLHPYLFHSLLSEINSKNFPFLYLVVLLLWDTQRFQLQFSSVTQSCPTLCDPMDCSTPGFSVHHQLSELAQTHVHQSMMPFNHLILCLSPSFLPSIFPSIRVFSNESVLHIGWPKYWSFSFSIGPSNEYSELISFRIDWFDLLAVQGTLKSPPTPKFKSISSSAFSFLHGPNLTSIHDYWKNHSFD